jgi:hypothetical protein
LFIQDHHRLYHPLYQYIHIYTSGQKENGRNCAHGSERNTNLDQT